MTVEPRSPSPPVDATAGDGRTDSDEAGVRRVLETRGRVHGISVTLRVLGWLAAAGCLLVGLAAVVAWLWQSLGSSAG
ncbi:MAG: hypothetical protein ACO3YY_01405 [Phycisphaerales bacterium]|jgi:hypothetical protein